MAQEQLDVLGRFIAEHLRDKGIDFVDALLAGRWKAPGLQELQRDVQELSAEQCEIVRRVARRALDGAIHDLLFALGEEGENGGPVRVLVGGLDVAQLSDGLQGEPYSPEGWYARFSKHGEPPDIA